MKRIAITSIAVALLATSTAFAQQKMDDMKSAEMPKATTAAHKTHVATGMVKKVDPKAGLVTLAHEPVESMNWPAMTMGFQVQDKMLFDKLTVGKKVTFEFVQGTKGYIVTAVK